MTTGKEQFEREFEAFLAEEESRVAALYRRLPQTEPDARLDAAVRAMAHRALNPQLVATPRTPRVRHRAARWLPAFGAAAGVVLAAGIAYKLGVPEGRQNDYSRPANEVIQVRPLDAPAQVAEPPLSPAPPVASAEHDKAPSPELRAAQKPKAIPSTQPLAARLDVEQQAQTPAQPSRASAAAAGADRELEKSAAAGAQPRAFPTAPAAAASTAMANEARQSLDDRAQGEHRKKAQAQLQDRLGFGEHAKQRRAPRDSDAATAAGAPVPPPPAAMAAPAAVAPSTASEAQTARAAPGATTVESKDATLRTAAPTQGIVAPASTQPMPREEAPLERAPPAAGEAPQRAASPAGAVAPAQGRAESGFARDALQQKKPASNDPDAHLYPEHWLANIRTMLRENHREDALRGLAEFRRRYPDYVLPEDLRDLK